MGLVPKLTLELERAGYKPIATCSPKHAPLILSLGAVSTYDYNSPSCASSIRTQTSNGVRHVLDRIADTASTRLCYAAMSRAGGRNACLELPSTAVLEDRKAVSWRFVMTFGREIVMGPEYSRDGKEGKEHRQRAARWAKEVQGLIDGGWLKGHQVEVLDEGEARGVKRIGKA